MAIPHPIPYQGSKRNLAGTILSYFPSEIDTLIEPFAGSAAISIASAVNGKARRYWFNDINESLILLWYYIINHPKTLGDFYERLWESQLGRERSFYDFVRKRFNQTRRPHYFLYLLARCVKASVRYNAFGEFNQSPDNRRRGRRPASMKHEVSVVSRLFQSRARLSNWDYREVLRFATPHDLVYMDPPYQGVSDGSDARYVSGICHKEFAEALAELNERHVPFIVSYDGRTGTKKFGRTLPANLNLHHIEVKAGRSTQATLLGRSDSTVESLYMSPAVMKRISKNIEAQPYQLSLLATV